jgi:hypothetical protein
MTRDTIIAAIERGLPLLISMADGRQYKVRDTFEIALSPTNAYVVGEDGQGHVAPYSNMTSLKSLKSDDAAQS